MNKENDGIDGKRGHNNLSKTYSYKNNLVDGFYPNHLSTSKTPDTRASCASFDHHEDLSVPWQIEFEENEERFSPRLSGDILQLDNDRPSWHQRPSGLFTATDESTAGVEAEKFPTVLRVEGTISNSQDYSSGKLRVEI